MAYESYNNLYNNNPPPPQQPTFSASYPPNDTSSNPYPPYMPYDVSQYAPDPRSHASTHSLDAAQDSTLRPHQARDYRPSQPHVFEAVNEAFDKSEPVPPPNTSSSQIPHDIIQQITEQVRTQVLNDLKANPVITPQAAPPQPQVSMPIPIPQQQQPQYIPAMHQSPVATSLPRPVYTPPTPTRFEEDDSSDDSSPTAHAEPKYHTQKEDLNDRYGDRSIQMEERSRSRPPVGSRQRTDEEETTLEKIWQPLFDSEGRPTMRLAQFLRGVALHLIEDYEPKLSLVIPPNKMLRFYDEVSVSNEPYPWRDLFARIRPDVLSRVYRSLGCVHHFIQGEANSQPSIPALTPAGFCQWLTLLIQAHPETEFQRLAIVVRDMPISNADDRRERLPKELSRRLFPRQHNPDIRHRCAAALLPPPPPGCPPAQRTSVSDATPTPQTTAGASREPSRTSPPPASAPPLAPTFAERERAPYSASVPGGTSTAPTASLPFRNDSGTSTGADVAAASTSSLFASVSDSGTTPLERVTSLPIERERKPYTAKEGQGKVHEASGRGGRATGSDATIKPPPPSALPQSSAAPPLSAADPLRNGELDERRRSRSYSQRYSMPPPPPPPPLAPPPASLASSSSSDIGMRTHHYHQHQHGSVSSGAQPSPLAAGASAAGPARSDTAPKRSRSPSGSVGSSSNGYAPASGVQYGGGGGGSSGSGIMYSSSEDEYVASSGSKRDREDRRSRERERRKEERREREREREYERRERERDKLEYERRERDRLERDRERAEREYRRQTEERERFVDDDVNVSGGGGGSGSYSQQQQYRRSTVGGATNGYGPPPTGGALARGTY